MAQKRKKKKGRLKTLLFFVFTPLIVWLLAFLIWFYWNPITRLLSKSEDQSKPRPRGDTRHLDKSERSNTSAEKRDQEQILDEERKKLDEILRRQRNSQ